MKIPVKLDVIGASGLEDQVRSYFAREFRTIGDVVLSNEQSLLAIHVVIMTVKNRTGAQVGYTMSIAVTDRLPIVMLAVAGNPSPSDTERQKLINKNMPVGGILVDHILQTLDSDSLPETCKALAAQIDGKHIESIRKLHEILQKALRDQKKK